MDEMIKTKKVTERIAYAAVFTALAIALSLIENLIPIGLIVPIPGVKIGLANIVTVFCVVMFSVPDTFAIILVRCLVMGLYTGPVALAFSLSGALLAWIFMYILSFGIGKIFSVIGVSIAGAAAHSAGQMLVAVILLKDTGVLFYYLPFLLLISIVTGSLTGLAAIPAIRYVRKAVKV